MTQRWTPRQVFAAYLISTLLMQAAWILTMPAFRGIDEFDHVYKAAAVARGQWTAPDPAPHGRGGIVTIPGSIVRAASPVCRYYDYVGHDNCFPIRTVGHGLVEVATGAGSYNPAFYVIVGTITRPFPGAAADFAMRATTALLCALLVAWAAAVIARWATTPWPLLALTIGLTPVLVYSTAIVAPNGVTYSSAALVWAALMGLARSPSDARGLALPLTIGSVALVATHTTGVMWLALAVATVVVLRPVSEWTRLLRRRLTTWILATGVVMIATALCLAWFRLAHTNTLSTKTVDSGSFPFEQLPLFHTLWALQAIAVFPLRDERAPAPVYVIWGAVLLTVLLMLFRIGGRRERIAGFEILGLLVVVPTILTVMSYRTESFAWQGRYSLPLWLGITSLAGFALDKRRRQPTMQTTWVLFAMLAIAMTISTVHVGLNEISHGPADPVVAGLPGGIALVGVLTVLGALAPLAVVGTRKRVLSPVGTGHHPSIGT